ncbi:hypothetical protein M878_42665 [Streptomyces roseochromogenus subsp. oscitans DS 12.976]|uniref:Phosphoglycerate mutase n=2 Tax=Streptomyces roseochromogenus TaxID=285450 RepID=V6JH38_STRRC|nr:hypothetical protein M878_42665 [Streptomyces roseochromogenus subsp. oscitans DS 12.976]
MAAAVPVILAGCDGKHAHKAASGPSGAPASGVPVADNTVIMIIRHGEKPGKHESGFDQNGRPDAKSLTQHGWERARALPRLFDPPKGQALKPGIMRPRTIYAAADQGPLAGAHRMRETVTPLSQHMGIALTTTYAESEETALAKAALSAPQPVLICWEHSRIPAIVDALGASHSGAPAQWPERFDLVWVFTHTGGSWTFRQVGQHLLPGDV